MGLTAGNLVGVTRVRVDKGASVMAAGYAQEGSVGRIVGTGVDVGRIGEGVADGSGLVAVAVGAVKAMRACSCAPRTIDADNVSATKTAAINPPRMGGGRREGRPCRSGSCFQLFEPEFIMSRNCGSLQPSSLDRPVSEWLFIPTQARRRVGV